MKTGKPFISLLVVFLLLGALAVFQATRESAASVVNPSDLAVGKHGDISRIRVAGRVLDEGIEYQVQPKIVLRFLIEDREKKGAPIPVVYEGLKPDMFAGGRDVLVDGDYRAGTLQASTLLTQCPSKYEPPSPAEGMNSTPKGPHDVGVNGKGSTS